MKPHLARLTFGLITLTSVASAAPFLAIGDGAELFATGTVGVRADDNIFLSNNKTSDTIFELTPGAEITFGKDAQLKGALTLVDQFDSYASNTNLNTNLFSGDFRSNYDDGKLKLGFATGYHELNQNTVDNRGLTRRDVSNIAGNGETEISEITSLGGGITFTHSRYKRLGYGDSDDTVVPLNFYYKMTPKLDVSGGYQYRDFSTTVGRDSTDNYFNVGARGEFTPLLTGQFRVGYLDRKISGANDFSMLGLDGSLTFAMTPKSSLQLTAANTPDTSPQGLQQKNFSLGANATFAIDDQWAANAGINYRAIKYPDHTDDYVEGTLGGTYTINAYVKIIGAYVYRHNSSKFSSSEFTNNVFSLSGNLRY
jgi:hypothetical protein